ncbi:hypothetical protein RJ639_014792 [Escallonia herrerae]|uniref:Reverse transcriptase Ty1/copia-type domain-containing protein n=1 Tax=Escallonia herrerae TaxID=1293975 RepID=A0AA88VHV5_9ASTE|nr:hypothetical protein RJ639_014792 [Escallonia herrerae]
MAKALFTMGGVRIRVELWCWSPMMMGVGCGSGYIAFSINLLVSVRVAPTINLMKDLTTSVTITGDHLAHVVLQANTVKEGPLHYFKVDKWRSSHPNMPSGQAVLRPTVAHRGDHLSQLSSQLTSHKLTEKNYLELAQSVKLAIDGRGKLGHFTEDVRQPAASNPSLSSWRFENSLIITWLINSMEPTIGKTYLFLHTAKDVWEAVRETYSDVENSSQIFDLKTKLWKSKQGEREVTIYYNEIVSLWQELDQCYNDEWDCPSDSVNVMKMEECDRVYLFLAGLNSDFDEVWSRILGKKPVPSLCEAFSEIRSEETRRKVMLTNLNPKPAVDVENSALVVKGNEYDNDKKKRPWCDHCKKSWHTKETCWKIHRKPPNWKKRNGSDNRAFQVSNEGNQGQQISPENITMADGPNFLINTELSGLNNENLDPKSIGLSDDIDGTKMKDQHIAILIVYVDDIILTGDCIAEMEGLKQCLASEFEIKDLGSLKFFLRMEIARSRKGIAVSQRKYALDLLKETSMSGCRPVETPIDPNQKLGDNKGVPVNTSRYQKPVGKLIYLSHTRPNIAFAVSLMRIGFGDRTIFSFRGLSFITFTKV